MHDKRNAWVQEKFKLIKQFIKQSDFEFSSLKINVSSAVDLLTCFKHPILVFRAKKLCNLPIFNTYQVESEHFYDFFWK